MGKEWGNGDRERTAVRRMKKWRMGGFMSISDY
jgi:hypothetical protein